MMPDPSEFGKDAIRRGRSEEKGYTSSLIELTETQCVSLSVRPRSCDFAVSIPWSGRKEVAHLRLSVRVFVSLLLAALVVHASFSLGSFQGALKSPWKEALSTQEVRRAYECSREAWYAAQRMNLANYEADFYARVDTFYGAVIDLYAESEDSGGTDEEARTKLAQLQQKFRSSSSVIPPGVRWYFGAHRVVIVAAGVAVVLCSVSLQMLPKKKHPRGRNPR